MRICQQGLEYIFTITDRQSRGEDGKPSVLTMRYRLPDTEERQEYINNLMQNINGEIISKHAETRLLLGQRIITGIGEGCFGRVDEHGEIVPMSSDPSSPHYFKEWKSALVDGAGDIVASLGFAVFETSNASVTLGASAEKN